MNDTDTRPDLTGRHVLIAGGSGAVGEGIVRAYLEAGAEVIVPTRSERRADQLRRILGSAASDRLHLLVADYTSFAGAEALADHILASFGALDDVVASIGGWWAGKPLWQIDEADWNRVFVDLTTAHVAVLRAFLPMMSAHGAYTLILGGSAFTPVPGSGLVNMEQAALLMMQHVLTAEAGGQRRVFSLVLGPVMTRQRAMGDPDWVTAGQVGQVAVAASGAVSLAGREIRMRSQADVAETLRMLGSHASESAGAGSVATAGGRA